MKTFLRLVLLPLLLGAGEPEPIPPASEPQVVTMLVRLRTSAMAGGKLKELLSIVLKNPEEHS